MQQLKGISYETPFPHLILKDFYNEKELELIWEELKFYTKPGKLLEAKDFGGISHRTNSHAIQLDELYSEKKFRGISNILTVNRKLFDGEILKAFAKIHDCCRTAPVSNWDVTKVRYYHNNDYYQPHTDSAFHFLSFSYFYREPKKFSGGEIFFPDYDYEYSCDNNSMIILPAWVNHGVKEVSIKDSDYYDGWGRYCISNFFMRRDGK